MHIYTHNDIDFRKHYIQIPGYAYMFTQKLKFIKSCHAQGVGADLSSAAMFSQCARPCQCTPSMSMASSRAVHPHALPHLGMLSCISSLRLRCGSAKASICTVHECLCEPDMIH